MESFSKIGIDNLMRIHLDKFEKDFAFIVNGEIYKTSSFVANILSPNVSNMLIENMNSSYYEIMTKNKGDFNRIIEYGEMKAINISEEEKQYFKNIMKLLGNTDEYLRHSKEFHEDVSYENVIQRIQSKKELNLNLNEEIEFISSNFHDFYMKYPNSIFKLDVDILEQIISNNKLKLLKEEELLDVILKLYIKSKEYSALFSYVIFVNLSAHSIREFYQSFDINDINHSIWKNICDRLEQNILDESIKTYQKLHQEFLENRYIIKYKGDIIQYLSEQCQGNVHTKSIVHITS